MNRVRRRGRCIALATIAVQVTVMTLSLVRVCSGMEHTHAGSAAPDCPMHHHSEPQPAAHAHHNHGSMAGHAARTDERISCSCADDAIAIYYGPHAIVPTPASSLPSLPLTPIVVAGDAQPASLFVPPDSPPPRS